jgi:hypothetical protein
MALNIVNGYVHVVVKRLIIGLLHWDRLVVHASITKTAMVGKDRMNGPVFLHTELIYYFHIPNMKLF